MAKTKEFCRHPQRAEAEKEATRLATLMGSSIHQAGQTHQFQNRGFSERTIKALAKSVDAPERLLFMREHEIEKIPGIGEASVREIRLYREKFLPGEP
jgi:ERCC4-type nuclease